MLAGIDEGIPYRVDPMPVTLAGELLARLQSRQTYAVTLSGYITYRDAGRIGGADMPAVVCAHACRDIEPEYLCTRDAPIVTRLVERASRTSEDLAVSPEEENAVFTIAAVLGNTRVIEDGQSPPF